MFQRILVPLDGSRRAESALPIAVRLVRASSASICLVRVAPTSASYFWGATEEAAMFPELLQAEQQDAQGYLQKAVASPELQGLSVSYQLAEGEPARAILDIVQAQKADLLVMCSHGATGLRRWVLGSVAHKIARHCPIPVLILHEQDEKLFTLWNEEPGRARILVPLDGSSLAEEALEPALTLALALSAPGQAALHLLRVVPDHDADGRSYAESGARTQKVHTYLKQVEEQVKSKLAPEQKVTLTSSVLQEGDVASAVVNFSQHGILPAAPSGERVYDVIAMTTHGHNGFSRWHMGSVTARVLDTSRVPLLVLRPGMMQSE